MENKEKPTVPFYAYESTVAEYERHIKRLLISLMIAVILLFVSNALWLHAWCSYDYTSTVTVDGKTGTANYIGNNGDIHNGENSCPESESTQEPQEG